MKKTRYKKRNERRKNPRPIQPQERDDEIYEALYIHRLLSTEQITKLFFGGSYDAAKKRLAKLYDHWYLGRVALPVVEGASPIVHVLSREGVARLRELHAGEEEYDNLTWYSSSERLKARFIRHTMAVNEVFIAVTFACEQPDWTLLEWKSESQIKSDYDPKVDSIVSGGERIPIIPDAYCKIRTSVGETKEFFLELDRSTMPANRFQTKIKGYRVFRQSGRCEKRYGEASVDVLTVVSSARLRAEERRRDNLKAATEAVSGRENWFWFAALEDVSPESIFTDAIWRRANHKGTHILIP